MLSAFVSCRFVSPIFALFLINFVFVLSGVLYVGYFLGMQLFGAVFLYCVGFVSLVVGYSSSLVLYAPFQAPLLIVKSPVFHDLIFLLIAFLGVFFLFYDRYFMRGIDYFSLGMAGARALINESERSGTVFSFFGHLLSYFLFLPLINVLFDWDERQRDRWVTFMLSTILALMLSYLMGGRTVVLMFLAVIASCLVGRKVLGLRAIPKSFSAWKVCSLILGALFFFTFVFYLRAEAFLDGDSGRYVNNLCDHLTSFMVASGGYLWSCDIAFAGEGVGALLNYLSAVLLYGFHVLWVGDFSYYSEPRSSILMAGFSHLFLSRIGLAIPSHDYAGFFVPAVAAVYHDLGALGVMLVFFTTGCFLVMSAFFLRSGRFFLGRYAFVVFFSVCVLSLLISPSNIPGFLILLICIFLVCAANIFFSILRNLIRCLGL
ncbi:hypothetical protein FIU84_12735 [Stutzerimonas frequens]|uniref:hypothetical protein n=1 Tax=Stutzerimonas frequens TaxID=2968969 RepID=UPI0012694A0A|nr:hypothetical protein [Stutzerimonas frequens]QFU12853.1 hypothetical protein FIU84_12735 [Stutzerimonas frequens]